MKEFKELFKIQLDNQTKLLKLNSYDSECKSLPYDDIKIFSYQIQQLMSEIGEVLDSDKRWKNMRNKKYNRDDKLNELADCFIVLMNLVMFSGFSCNDILSEIEKKLTVFNDRINVEYNQNNLEE